MESVSFMTKIPDFPEKSIRVDLYLDEGSATDLRGKCVSVLMGKGGAMKVMDSINTQGLVGDIMIIAINQLLLPYVTSVKDCFVANFETDFEIIGWEAKERVLSIGIYHTFNDFEQLLSIFRGKLKRKKRIKR